MCIETRMGEFRPPLGGFQFNGNPPNLTPPRAPPALSSLSRPRVAAPSSQRAPQLQPELLAHLTPLNEELTALTPDSARFSSFGPNLITDSAAMFARYGRFTIERFLHIGKQARISFRRFETARSRNLPTTQLFRSPRINNTTTQPRGGSAEYPIRRIGYASNLSG